VSDRRSTIEEVLEQMLKNQRLLMLYLEPRSEAAEEYLDEHLRATEAMLESMSVDDTEHLLSSEANAERLMRSIKQAKGKQ
jgi:inorganic triphosphatase YgiF